MPDPDSNTIEDAEPGTLSDELSMALNKLNAVLTPPRMDKTLLANAAETLDPNYTDEFTPPEMKKYQSHKVVEAFKIGRIREPRNVGELYVLESRQLGDEASAQNISVSVGRAYIDKHKPEVGGYYVRYPDGYESWSPADAFEGGYAELPEVDPAKDARWDFIDEVARLAHLVNREYCRALGEAMPDWDNAADWQKHSARMGVAGVLDNPDTTPEALHASWMRIKIEDGWVYGETKDDQAKTHPCLMPYNDLPIEQRAKDFIFRGIVMASAGIPIPDELEANGEPANAA